MAPIATLAEKVLWTFVQSFLGALALADVLDVSTAQAAAIASIPAALTVLANGLPTVPLGLTWWLDAIFRTIRTYAVGFIGYVVAVPVFSLDYSIAVAASAAALPAALAVLKAAIAARVGSPASAATLPARLDVAA